jgi:hypothetical protein
VVLAVTESCACLPRSRVPQQTLKDSYVLADDFRFNIVNDRAEKSE